MNLKKKKDLISRTLKVGRERIVLNARRIDELKDAITKQDIRELLSSGAIIIREITGSRRKERRNNRRRGGSIRLRIKKGKRGYIILTRKLRNYVSELLSQEKISKEQSLKLRREIKAHTFKSKAHFKEHIGGLG